ncbi:unnamed protein product [Paramecium sonneborni]|uniref:Uncharacterized protein n=1 Tax=Paramecium sonneborni TaxID=65129 RepID=A0A8S1RV85_9CILI|nr:unnamed protein product [Paramecium sonneborni]
MHNKQQQKIAELENKMRQTKTDSIISGLQELREAQDQMKKDQDNNKAKIVQFGKKIDGVVRREDLLVLFEPKLQQVKMNYLSKLKNQELNQKEKLNQKIQKNFKMILYLDQKKLFKHQLNNQLINLKLKKALIYLEQRKVKEEKRLRRFICQKQLWSYALCDKELVKFKGQLGDYRGWAHFPSKETSPERMGRILYIYDIIFQLGVGYKQMQEKQKNNRERYQNDKDRPNSQANQQFYQTGSQMSQNQNNLPKINYRYLMNNQQQIIAVLTKTKESQQKIKVKTSKYLKQLDIFKMQLNPKEIRLYQQVMNNYHMDYQIVQEINLKLMVVQENLHIIVLNYFSIYQINIHKELNSLKYLQILKMMHINYYHYLLIFQLIKKIQDKGLVAMKDVLEIKKLKEQLEIWYKRIRVQQIQEQIQQTSWKESDQPPPENLNLQREQNKRQKKLEHITLQWDGNPEYLIKTFYNPLILQQRTTKSNKNRNAALKKVNCRKQSYCQNSNEFISKEFKDQIKRKKSLASNDKSNQPMQVDKIAILGSLSKRTFQLLSKLNQISQSMNKLRMSQQKLKSVIDFIRKCEQYVQLPNQLKEAYLQRSNAQVMKLISLQKENMNQYKNISLFKQLNEQIDQIMKQIYNNILQQIKQENLEYNQILEIGEYIKELNLTQNSTQDIVNNLQQSIKNFNAYFNKTLQSRDNEAYQIEMIRGDFIIEFLQQCYYLNKNYNYRIVQLQKIFQIILKFMQRSQFQSKYEQIKGRNRKQDVIVFRFSLKSWFNQQYNALLCQRINQDIESIKSMVQIIINLFGDSPKLDNQINDIEVKSLSLQFSNYTLKQIKVNFVVPQKDVFGINFSEFMLQIFIEILKISKNKNVDRILFLQLLQDSLNYLQQNCKESQDYLIFLHNIKLISSQIKDLAQSVYQNSKKLISFKEFAEPIQQQINGILSQYYQPCLQNYVKLLKLDQPQGMDMIPRLYVIQWLTVFNEQAVTLAQINLDQSVTDSMMSFIVSQCFKNIEAVSTHAKRAKFLDQLNYEINLLKIMTLTFQGSVSQEGFQRLQRKMDELSQNTVSETSEWARPQKIKM